MVKEIRRTLKELYFSQDKINYSVDYVSECCTIMKNAPKARFSKYDIQDKNDLPILVGAAQESAVLVTEDNILKKDAKKYLECETPSEALKRVSVR